MCRALPAALGNLGEMQYVEDGNEARR
jgi:hypothetical protein